MAESPYLRYPHLARDLITFTAEDDVWLASLSEAAGGQGTRAWRLTADQAPVLHPRLNPSATHVAWTSTRDGSRSLRPGAAREVYAVSAEGGPVRRLTYWGDRFATVRGWVSDIEVLALSRAGQHSSMKTWAFAVPLGGPARRLGYGPAGDVAVRDGAVLVGSAMNFEPAEPAHWKRYRGGAGGKIWYSPDGSHYTRIFADVGLNLVNPMFAGPRVVFLSDHEGTGALYSALPDGADLRRHADLGQYYARHATTDGHRVVYQRAGEIWMLESLDAEPVRLDIRLSGARSGRAPYPVPAKSQLGSFALDSTGRVLGAEVRGTVHWLPGRDGPARALLAEPGVRARLPVVIPGMDAVACASDNGGEDGLDVIPADGSAARRIGHGEFGRILELAVAPDGHTAAVACADGRLLTVALEGEPVITEIARSSNAEVAGLAFSPDSALLAWSQPWRPERGAAQIRLARLADGTVTDVTPPRFDDTSPAFTLDGKYLAFLSNRAFDPVFDAHHWDLGFLPGVRPYLVPLLATTPSPFAPELNGRPVEPEGPGEIPATVGLDVAGLAERIVPFPVAAGRYDKLRAASGGVVWLDLPRAGELGETVIGARSPLAAPGVAAAPGDLIVAVDGRPVHPDLGPNALLAGKADQPVELTLRRDGADRRAVVVPLASEHAARYYEMVARQRATVCEASGGRLGYLNIPDMMARGWAEFHRDLYTEFRRDGLIVDLRDTQGGDAGQLVAEKLARRIIGWNLSRYEEPSSYPADAPRGPIVAITDEYASSGGDLVIQALKSYRIATVVGTCTWGGVRGVDLKYELVDGTLVAQPKYAYWFAGAGWALENHGVDPDIEVTIAPHDWAAGRDPQLDTAVRLALQALEKRAPAAPPTV